MVARRSLRFLEALAEVCHGSAVACEALVRPAACSPRMAAVQWAEEWLESRNAILATANPVNLVGDQPGGATRSARGARRIARHDQA